MKTSTLIWNESKRYLEDCSKFDLDSDQQLHARTLAAVLDVIGNKDIIGREHEL